MMKNKDQFKAFNIYGFVFNGIGVLVKESLIDINLPMLFYGGGVVFFWKKFGPFIKEARIRWNAPNLLVQLEDLYNIMNKYSETHPDVVVANDLSFGMGSTVK